MIGTPITQLHHDLYTAVYDNDGYKLVTTHFDTYLAYDDALQACNWLIDACFERIVNPPYDLTAIMWGAHEIALRRLLWDKLTQDVWMKVIDLVRTYLLHFSRAARVVAWTKFTVTANDWAGIRWTLSSWAEFRNIGALRVHFTGVVLDVKVVKNSLLGKQQWNQYVFESAVLNTPQGRQLRPIAYSEIVWPDGIIVNER